MQINFRNMVQRFLNKYCLLIDKMYIISYNRYVRI